MKSVKVFWDNIINFTGTTDRKDFWIGNIMNAILLLIVYFAGSFFIGFFGWMVFRNDTIIDTLAGVFLFALCIPYFIAAITSCIRRLRDAGISPWFLLLGFIPLVGIVPFVMYFFPSKEVSQHTELTN